MQFFNGYLKTMSNVKWIQNKAYTGLKIRLSINYISISFLLKVIIIILSILSYYLIKSLLISYIAQLFLCNLLVE